jgi:16S rRNA processing protein RimM
MSLPEAKMEAAGGESQPSTQQSSYLVVGKLHRPHGVHGEMTLEVLTDFPERLHEGITLYVGEKQAPMQLVKVRQHAKGLLVSFQGCSTPEAAGELRNQFVYVPAADRPPLPEGDYYHHQIIGLQVLSDQGEPLGTVSEILETGANDVFVIRPKNGPEILVPDTDEVILRIDLMKGEMIIHLLPGLLPPEAGS